MSNAAILAVLSTADTARAVLTAAEGIRVPLGSPPVQAVRLRPAVEPGFMPTEEVMTEDRARRFQEQEDVLSASLPETFDRWTGERSAEGWTSFREVVADPDQAIQELGEACALIVAAHPAADREAATAALVRDVLFRLRRPILVVPASLTGPIGRHVAVAWKDSRATRRAVEASLPILRAADEVIALEAAEGAGARVGSQPGARPLLLHGIRVAVNRFSTGQHSVAHALLHECRSASVDLLVMGAWTHNRLIEAMLGGVTRDMLARAELPLLMCH